MAADGEGETFGTIGQTTTTGTTEPGHVDLVGTLPGTPPGNPGDPGGSGRGVGATEPPPACAIDQVTVDWCRGYITDPSAPPAPGAPTITDIASFHPRVGTAHLQPNGWGVVGIHTNFFADGTQHVVAGTLLGQPANVRFTPVAWHWDYGDGSTAVAAHPGDTWEHLGIREFNQTPASHVYTTRGTYTITLTVEFAAEYQFAGQPYLPIAGTVHAPANNLTITTWRAKTLLVAQDCLTNPTGPGCPGS